MPEHTPAPTPNRAVYGFVLYLCSYVFFFGYITWAVVPEEWFRAMNITYLPKQYWAVSIPVFLLTVLATFAFIIYPSLNLCLTPAINDVRTITEVKPKKQFVKNHKNNFRTDFCTCKNKDRCFINEYLETNENSVKYGVPPVEDICIDDVSRKLYLK